MSKNVQFHAATKCALQLFSGNKKANKIKKANGLFSIYICNVFPTQKYRGLIGFGKILDIYFKKHIFQSLLTWKDHLALLIYLPIYCSEIAVAIL